MPPHLEHTYTRQLSTPPTDPAQTTQCLELDGNEAALSLCLAAFDSNPELGPLLCVGTAVGLKFYPREAEGK